MFKVGDVVKVVGGRRGDRYRVISIDIEDALILRNIHETSPSKNFMSTDNGHLVLDEIYFRRKKLDNIRDNIDSLYLMKQAKEMSELTQKAKWLLLMEQRKRKIEKICGRV